MLSNQKKIGIASDHAGFELKEFIIGNISSNSIDIQDFGTFNSDSADYPDYAHLLGRAVNSGELLQGIAICGSGQGMSITLNKYQNVRAALCWKEEIAQLARRHNDANIVVLPARFIEQNEALQIIEAFFTSDFEGGRHQKRVDKIKIKP